MADPPEAFCPNCGTATMAPSQRYGPAPVRLSGLATACTALFAVVALAQLLFAVLRSTGQSLTAISVAATLAELALIPVFLIWFSRARSNAALWGPQRRSQGWSIGAWFTPVVFVWLPYQILGDIWRASQPATDAATASRRGPDAVAKAWWACWLLAWATGVYYTHSTTTLADGSTSQSTSFGVYLGGTVLSNCFTAAAAVLGLLVVRTVTRMQATRITA